MDASLLFRRLTVSTAEILKDAAQEELEAQGHYASGDLILSMAVRFRLQGAIMVAEIEAQDYGDDLEDPVPPSRIPRPGSAAYHDLISGLVEWASYKKPGLPPAEQEVFAYLVYRKMRQEGMPTRNAVSFSKNGRRTGWKRHSMAAAEPLMEAKLQNTDLIERIFEHAMREAAAGR